MTTGVLSKHLWSALHIALLLLVIQVILPGAVRAGGGPRDVAVVINNRSAASREIGKYYQAARGIPDSNICYVSCPEQEVVLKDICEKQIREPVRRFLNQPELAGKIDYIVITKGLPLGADYGEPTGPYSVASILTCADHPEIQEPLASPYGPLASNTWAANAPETSWRHSLNFNGYHFYAVVRLDAFTVDQVKTMIDRSTAPPSSGVYILDKNTYNIGAYKAANTRLGDQAGSAYACLTAREYPVVFDSGTGFIAGLDNVQGYFSWSAHDSKYSFTSYTSNSFAAGSVGDTYFSTSGRTFNDPGATTRYPLIADLVARGLCGAGGYVSEPYINAATYPNILFDRYTKGYNMAESFYAACPSLFWKTVIVGDPLMAPYATPPVVKLHIPQVLQGVVTIGVDAQDDSGISMVRFFIDDEMIAEDTQFPFTVDLDTTNYPIGAHIIEAVAFENSPVATQGVDKASVTVVNFTSAVSQIGDAFGYADGQSVRLTAKTVTAGTLEVGGSFYIEEQDRSSAIRVFGGQAVDRGDVVTVTGILGSWLGQRIIVNAAVNVLDTGAGIPMPLMIRVGDLGGVIPGPQEGSIKPGCGASNMGMLVKVVGRIVRSADDKVCIGDDSAKLPVRVCGEAAAELPKDAIVVLTGICTVDLDAGDPTAAVLVRDAADVQVLCWNCPVPVQQAPPGDGKPGRYTGFPLLPPMP